MTDLDLPLPTADPTLPPQIGKYRVLDRLGEGATSEVFLARDEFRGIDVAIKRVNGARAADEHTAHLGRHFFAAEAALVGRLNHPNIVGLLDAVDEGPSPYLVMEYVPGVTLRRFCRADALLSLEQIVQIGFKCAMALDYCWRQGLIHRDVKPANLLALMRGDDVVDVKISDFGSVLNLDSDRTQVFRVGSLAYMSPEQLNGDELDCRADIYSLGAVLYHLIAGRPPFDATQQPALMHQIYHGTIAPLTSMREGVSNALDAVVRHALARDRRDRPGSWDEFAQELSLLVSAGQIPREAEQRVLDSERFNLLRSLDFFSGFGDVELWEVVHRAHWQRWEPGAKLYSRGAVGNTFHILAGGDVEVYRNGRRVAQLDTGSTVGEMAYLAPNPELRTHSADVVVRAPATTISFTPETLMQLNLGTRSLFDAAFIRVLVRRLHAAQTAQEAAADAASAAVREAPAGAAVPG